MKEETRCPDCWWFWLHWCTGKKYPWSDDIVGINNFTLYSYQEEFIKKINSWKDITLLKLK